MLYSSLAPQATGWRRADTGPALGCSWPWQPPAKLSAALLLLFLLLLLLLLLSCFSSSSFSPPPPRDSTKVQLRRAAKQPPTHVFLLTCPTLLLPILPPHTYLSFKFPQNNFSASRKGLKLSPFRVHDCIYAKFQLLFFSILFFPPSCSMTISMKLPEYAHIFLLSKSFSPSCLSQ